MRKMVFLFPGQGAQSVGMGKDFYDNFSAARETFEEADDFLKQNFSKVIFEGPAEELTLTKNSQLAIFVASAAVLRALKSQFPDLEPAICAGLSLGEYTALFAAQKLSFTDCLKLVQARGSFMHDACLQTQGTMRVVLGLDEAAAAAALPSQVWIANLNCPGQIVIAGVSSAMSAAEEALKAAGAKRVLPIDVSGAFHTPLMKSAQERLTPYLEAASFVPSGIKLVMNVPGDFVDDVEAIRRYLIAQVAAPTRWEKGIRAIEASGVCTYLEIGPGKTLSGMNRKIGVGGLCLNIEKISDLEQFYASTQR